MPRATQRNMPGSARRILDEGKPFHGARVVAFVAPGGGQMTFIAGRRVGNAVQRNRARRIMRAAWQALAPHTNEGYDLALVARSAVRGAKTQDLVTEMTELLRRSGVILP